MQPIFDSKHIKNHDKPIYSLKKPNKHPKNWNQPKTKNELFLSNGPFDTKYRLFWWSKSVSVIFFSLYHQNLVTFSFPLSIQKLKNNKNKLLYQNWTWKILRYWDCIICVIFKVLGPECICCWKLWRAIHVWFIFILIPLLSTISFLKKSQSIGL